MLDSEKCSIKPVVFKESVGFGLLESVRKDIHSQDVYMNIYIKTYIGSRAEDAK